MASVSAKYARAEREAIQEAQWRKDGRANSRCAICGRRGGAKDEWMQCTDAAACLARFKATDRGKALRQEIAAARAKQGV